MRNIRILLLIILPIVAGACTVSYSFTGASISPQVKSYTIYDFTDRMRQNPTLSDFIAEQMKDKFTRQTSLNYANDGGDLEFEGSIVGYDVKPISVQSNDEASQNRLTIKVSMKFTNNKEPENDFETEFSAYADFSSEFNLSDVEEELVQEIVTQIINDIYNKAVANW
ncbi:MAG: LptE family protein [Prolixibacteraceae bacterium]|nr:LptE family protein [Prolixibacteraceae bacterium]